MGISSWGCSNPQHTLKTQLFLLKFDIKRILIKA